MKSVVVVLLCLFAVAFAFVSVSKDASQIECTMCEEAVLEVEHLIEDGEPDVKGEMDKWCKDLGKALSKPCIAMINQYLDNIITQLGENHGPGQICQSIDMCNKSQ